MSLREQTERAGCRALLGIRKEFPELDPVSAALLILRSRLHVLKHRSKLNGSLFPEQGPAIVAGNHQEDADSYKICVQVVKSHRLIRAVVKRGLVEEGFSESKDYLKTIEDNTPSKKYNYRRASVLKGVGSIPVNREDPGRQFLEETDAIIKSGQLLGIFLQPHRYNDCFLRNLQLGAATIARRHPNVRIYLCALSGPPYGEDKLTVLQPFTYAQKANELGRKIGVGELTIMFADAIAKHQPLPVWKDWQTRRAEELTRLTAYKK